MDAAANGLGAPSLFVDDLDAVRVFYSDVLDLASNGLNCPHTTAETTARVDDQVSWIRTVVTDLPR